MTMLPASSLETSVKDCPRLSLFLTMLLAHDIQRCINLQQRLVCQPVDISEYEESVEIDQSREHDQHA
jgi:hypothetical protein